MVNRGKRRTRGSTSPRSQARSTKVATQAPTRLVEQVVAAVVSAFVGLAISAVASQMGASPHYWVPSVIWVATAVGLAMLRPRVSRVAAVSALAVTFGSVAYLLFRPDSQEQRVVEYVKGTCADGMWIGRPTCYSSAVTTITEDFGAFDPDRWHGWSELKPKMTVPMAELAESGHLFSTQAFETAGEVLVTQHIGGPQVVIQLRPLDQADVRRARRAGGHPLAQEALTIGRGRNTNHVVYCNTSVRPFVDPRAGEIYAIRGVLLANGMTMDVEKQRRIQLSYVACSAVERLATAG